MTATVEELSQWFDHGIEHNATHMIVVWNSFSGEDSPIYVERHENVHKKMDELKAQPMQRVIEVYALHLNKASQLAEYRAFHYESP